MSSSPSSRRGRDQGKGVAEGSPPKTKGNRQLSEQLQRAIASRLAFDAALEGSQKRSEQHGALKISPDSTPKKSQQPSQKEQPQQQVASTSAVHTKIQPSGSEKQSKQRQAASTSKTSSEFLPQRDRQPSQHQGASGSGISSDVSSKQAYQPSPQHRGVTSSAATGSAATSSGTSTAPHGTIPGCDISYHDAQLRLASRSERHAATVELLLSYRQQLEESSVIGAVGGPEAEELRPRLDQVQTWVERDKQQLLNSCADYIGEIDHYSSQLGTFIGKYNHSKAVHTVVDGKLADLATEKDLIEKYAKDL